MHLLVARRCRLSHIYFLLMLIARSTQHHGPSFFEPSITWSVVGRAVASGLGVVDFNRFFYLMRLYLARQGPVPTLAIPDTYINPLYSRTGSKRLAQTMAHPMAHRDVINLFEGSLFSVPCVPLITSHSKYPCVGISFLYLGK